MDQNCSNNMTLIEGGAEPCRSEYNNWLVIVLLVIFLLVTNILMINLLIAMLTYTFEIVQEKSDPYWRFQYYKLIMEYQSRPRLAPPFIVINHLSLFICFLKKTFHGGWNEEEDRRKTEEERMRLKEWEIKQTQEFLSVQREIEASSDSEKIQQISDKVDRVDTALKQLTEKLTEITITADQRHRALETKVELILDLLTKAPWTKPQSS